MFWRGYRCIKRNAVGGGLIMEYRSLLQVLYQSWKPVHISLASRLSPNASWWNGIDRLLPWLHATICVRNVFRLFSGSVVPICFAHTFPFQLINDLPLIMLQYKTVSDTKSRIGKPSSNSGLVCYIHSRTNGLFLFFQQCIKYQGWLNSVASNDRHSRKRYLQKSLAIRS